MAARQKGRPSDSSLSLNTGFARFQPRPAQLGDSFCRFRPLSGEQRAPGRPCGGRTQGRGAIGRTSWTAGGGGYTVKAHFLNAGQLVKGNQVEIGGTSVGTVDDIALTADGQAVVTMSI